MSTRMNLRVDDDVPALLDDLVDSPHDKGKLVSQLIRQAHAGQRDMPDVEQMKIDALRLLVMGINGRITALEGHLQQLQAQIAAMIAER